MTPGAVVVEECYGQLSKMCLIQSFEGGTDEIRVEVENDGNEN